MRTESDRMWWKDREVSRGRSLLCAAAVATSAVVVFAACGDESATKSDPVETTRPDRSCVAVLQLGSLTPDIDSVFRELPAVQLGGAPATDGSGIAFYRGDTPVVSLDRPPLMLL